MQIFSLMAFMEQKENNNNDNLRQHGLYTDRHCYCIIFVLLIIYKGHKTENLQKECLILF